MKDDLRQGDLMLKHLPGMAVLQGHWQLALCWSLTACLQLRGLLRNEQGMPRPQLICSTLLQSTKFQTRELTAA